MKISQILLENEKEFDDIHSNFRVLLHSELGFPQKKETAGSMANRIKPHIMSFLRSSQNQLIQKIIEEVGGIDFFDWDKNTQRMIKQKVIDYLKEGIKI